MNFNNNFLKCLRMNGSLSVLLMMPVIAVSETHYVAPTGSASWADSTNINSPCSLATANVNADEDDIVYLRGGTYGTVYDHGVLEPENSGSNGHQITFVAFEDEIPVIDGGNSVIPGYLVYLSYITIDGLTFSNSGGNWSIISGGSGSSMQNGLIIQNCVLKGKGLYSKSLSNTQILNNTFSNITYAGINFSGDATYRSSKTRIEGNSFTGTYFSTDVITLHESNGYPVGDYHIIKNNIINNSGGENCLDLTSGRYIVADGNQCNGEVSSSGIGIGEHGENNHAYWIRIVNNIVHDSGKGQENILVTGEDSDYIQIGRNIMFGSGDHNIRITNSGSESHDGIRVFHNIMDGRELDDNINLQIQPDANDIVVKNNIFYMGNDDSAIDWTSIVDANNKADFNLYWNEVQSPEAVLWGYTPTYTLTEIKNTFFQEADGNEQNPDFINVSAANYGLQNSSPAIDSGGFLTTITSVSGEGTSFVVDDALWFYDGWNIPGEIGDIIKTEHKQSAIITSINYITGNITVDRKITWTNGEGIGLDYKGIRPDVGVEEISPDIEEPLAIEFLYMLLL